VIGAVVTFPGQSTGFPGSREICREVVIPGTLFPAEQQNRVRIQAVAAEFAQKTSRELVAPMQGIWAASRENKSPAWQGARAV